MSLYEKYPPPPDFDSDGCSVPWWLKPLYRKYDDNACRWHDWARRHLVYYGIFSVQEADWEFRRYMKDVVAERSKTNAWSRLFRKVFPWTPLIQVSWLVVKLARDRYSRTLPVPTKWISYLKPVEANDDNQGR